MDEQDRLAKIAASGRRIDERNVDARGGKTLGHLEWPGQRLKLRLISRIVAPAPRRRRSGMSRRASAPAG